MNIILGSLKYMCLLFAGVFGLIAFIAALFGPALIACYIESCGASENWVMSVVALEFPWLGFLMYVSERWKI